MKPTFTLAGLALVGCLTLAGCGGGGTTKPANGTANTQGSNSSGPPPAIPKGAPLLDRAFKASISALNPPETMSAGQQATVQVKLKNTSDMTWPLAGDTDGKYQIKLGNHWLDQNSKPVVIDDGRTPLTTDLKPGAEIELPLIVTAPAKPGSYVLEIDVVQENVAWSGDKGNSTFKVKVQVK
jgi:hypothetical protein